MNNMLDSLKISRRKKKRVRVEDDGVTSQCDSTDDNYCPEVYLAEGFKTDEWFFKWTKLLQTDETQPAQAAVRSSDELD